MTMKKQAVSVREELRVLNSAADDLQNPAILNWLTPEFWSMATTAVTNLVAVAVLIGWVSSTNADSVVQALTALIGATEALVLNGALVWKYLSSRTQLREQLLSARLQYMETLAIERMRERA